MGLMTLPVYFKLFTVQVSYFAAVVIHLKMILFQYIGIFENVLILIFSHINTIKTN